MIVFVTETYLMFKSKLLKWIYMRVNIITSFSQNWFVVIIQLQPSIMIMRKKFNHLNILFKEQNPCCRRSLEYANHFLQAYVTRESFLLLKELKLYKTIRP